MLSPEVFSIALWVLGGLLTTLAAFSAVIWSMIRKEASDHSAKLEQKVDHSRFQDLEARFLRDVESVRDNNEKVIDRLELKHNRDMESMQSNFREQMQQIREALRTTETNILNQMNLLFKSNHNT